MTGAPGTFTTWSVNELAARAIALHGSSEPHVPPPGQCRHCEDALELIDICGLSVVTETGVRQLVPDDGRQITLGDLNLGSPPPEDDESRARSLTTRPSAKTKSTAPPGLYAAPAPTTTPKKKAPAMPPIAAPPLTRAQEQTRELLASVAPPTVARPAPAARPLPDTDPDIRPGAAAAGGPYVAALSVVELFVDPTYQRPLDAPRVKRMVADWQPRMLGILDVSDRGTDAVPRYAIINGQHRWAAAGRVGLQYLACNVHEGLTPVDEAALMFELDRTTKKLSGWDKWRARRGAGDPTVATVEAIAAARGLRVDDTGELRSYGTAEKLLTTGGEQLLDTSIAVLHTAYGASPLAFQAPLLMGVGQLLHQHDVDVDRLTRALAGTRPEQLRSHATALREIEGGPLHELMTRAVATAYNRLPGARLSAKAS